MSCTVSAISNLVNITLLATLFKYQPRILLILLGLTCAVSATAGDADVLIRNADSQKIASIRNNRLTNTNGDIIYTIKGNIVFEGQSTEKNQIELLLKTQNILEDAESRIFPRHMNDVKFTVRKGRIYYKKGLQIKDAGLIAEIAKIKDKVFVLKNYKGNRLATIHGADVTSAQLVAVFYHIYNKRHLGRDVSKRIANVREVKDKQPKQQQDEHGIIKPYWARGGKEWVWDGEILKPRWGGNRRDRWQFDGRILKPVYFSDPHEEWVWDGEKLEPKWNDNDINTYIWEDNELQPYWVSDTKREYELKENIIKPIWGNRPKDEWIIEGEVPKPVITIVVLGIADR